MVDVWQETLPVRFGDIDTSDRLTLAAAFDLFQEVAISHAENLGVGRDNLARTRQAWVLSRISVVMDRRPKYAETITVRSWPRGSEKLFAVRDYDIRVGTSAPGGGSHPDADNQAIVRGRSGWLILDLDKRRPLRIQPIIEHLPKNEGLDALPGGAQGLETRADLIRAGERRAAYSDIDYNGHVNNARYIQWIQDAAEPGTLEGADRIRFDINYLSEVKSGELVELWTAPAAPTIQTAPNSDTVNGSDVTNGSTADCGSVTASYSRAFAFEGRRAEGGQAVFRAELRTGA
jgi:acyl-ACP thioesterase